MTQEVTVEFSDIRVRYVAPSDGGWIIACTKPESMDDDRYTQRLQALAAALVALPGIDAETVECQDDEVVFDFDFDADVDPAETRARVEALFVVELIDHIIASVIREASSRQIKLRLEFRLDHDHTALEARAVDLQKLDGVRRAAVVDKTDIVLDLNPHYAERAAIDFVVGCAAHALKAHVIRVNYDTSLHLPMGGPKMSGGIPGAVPTPAPPLLTGPGGATPPWLATPTSRLPAGERAETRYQRRARRRGIPRVR